MRRAQGVKAQDIARECRLEVPDVERWLAEDEMSELVECCRAMMDVSVEERLAKLEREALVLLEIAVEARDVRVALFLADQFSRGKNPARVLAEAVNRKVTQSTKPLDEPLSKPEPPPPEAALDPPAVKRKAAFARVMRPWAHAISTARRQLGEELVRAFPTARHVSASTRQAKAIEPAAAPVIFQSIRASGIDFSNFAPVSSTSPSALMSANPRDGPNP